MKIQKVNEEMIEFDNGNRITFYHRQDCCEHVYADFESIDDLALDYDFEPPIFFEQVEDYGFRFGNPGKMVSVPCYNEQNGYYDHYLEIRYCGNTVINDCEKKHEILGGIKHNVS